MALRQLLPTPAPPCHHPKPFGSCRCHSSESMGQAEGEEVRSLSEILKCPLFSTSPLLEGKTRRPVRPSGDTHKAHSSSMCDMTPRGVRGSHDESERPSSSVCCEGEPVGLARGLSRAKQQFLAV